jgi:DNA-binding response OmpR family regulator
LTSVRDRDRSGSYAKEVSLQKKKILFIDDSATMRTIAEKTFFAEPFELVTVPSGQAAVAKFKEVLPSIVLVDAGMAGVNGYDVCKAIRDDATAGKTPIIIMSGVSNPYDENRGRDVGATEHVKKPFDTAKLIERVVELTKAAPVAEEAEAIPLQPKPIAALLPSPAPAAQPAPAAAKPFAPPVLPVVPATPKAPVRPVAAPVGAPKMAAQSTVKETMEFGRLAGAPAATPARPADVAPIDIGAPPRAEAAEFQVGTLAELAQMDATGRQIRQAHPEDAIELKPSPPAATPSPPAEPIAAAAAVVREQASAAAAKVAAQLGGGLTSDQVAALQKLSAEVIERVVWEVVPDLAEAIIREQIEKLLQK